MYTALWRYNVLYVWCGKYQWIHSFEVVLGHSPQCELYFMNTEIMYSFPWLFLTSIFQHKPVTLEISFYLPIFAHFPAQAWRPFPYGCINVKIFYTGVLGVKMETTILWAESVLTFFLKRRKLLLAQIMLFKHVRCMQDAVSPPELAKLWRVQLNLSLWHPKNDTLKGNVGSFAAYFARNGPLMMQRYIRIHK